MRNILEPFAWICLVAGIGFGLFTLGIYVNAKEDMKTQMLFCIEEGMSTAHMWSKGEVPQELLECQDPKISTSKFSHRVIITCGEQSYSVEVTGLFKKRLGAVKPLKKDRL